MGRSDRVTAAQCRGETQLFYSGPVYVRVREDGRSDSVVRPIILPSHGNDQGSNPCRSILSTPSDQLRPTRCTRDPDRPGQRSRRSRTRFGLIGIAGGEALRTALDASKPQVESRRQRHAGLQAAVRAGAQN